MKKIFTGMLLESIRVYFYKTKIIFYSDLIFRSKMFISLYIFINRWWQDNKIYVIIQYFNINLQLCNR